jgi:NTE family protein
MDIALALGGGGSRGFAHIGVLRRLEAEGFRIRAVAGTSAGGIIAAVYAAGYSPDEMESLFSKIDQSKLFALSFSEGPGLLSLSNASKLLGEFLGDRTFDDLKLPCALVAVDVKSAQEVILNKGRVVDAILATIAIPGVFPPKILGEHELVDGGVLNPVPVSVARSLAPRMPVAAVVLSPAMEKPGRFAHIPLPVKIPTPIVERLTRLRVAQAFNIFLQSVDIGQRMITQLRLEADAPEVVIRPEVSNVGLLDKVEVSEVTRLGEKATEAVLPDLFRAVSWPRRMGRQLFPPGEGRGKAATTR